MLCVSVAHAKSGVQREFWSHHLIQIGVTLKSVTGLILYNVIVVRDTFICAVYSHL
jgi:hypothetical protein